MDIKTEKYASDNYEAYDLLPDKKHLWGKAHTYTVERTNRRLRHYLARLVRKTYCYSKSEEMLYLSVILFMFKDIFGTSFFYKCMPF